MAQGQRLWPEHFIFPVVCAEAEARAAVRLRGLCMGLGRCSCLHAQLAVDSIVWASEASRGAVAWMGQVARQAQQATSWPLQPPAPAAPHSKFGTQNLSLSLARERAPRSVIIKLH